MADETKTTTTQSNDNGTGDGKTSEKTFTQAELDAIVGKSKKQARENALKAFYEEKGVSAEEAESAISEFLKNKKPAEPETNAALQSRIEAAEKARTEAVISQKATVEAIKQNVSPEKVKYLLKMGDFSSVLDDDGNVDDDKLSKAVSAVLEEIPELKKSAENIGGFNQIGGDGQGDGKNKKNEPKRTVVKPWNRFNRI
jgi:hypothetical protein